jgi:hypothetical protein
MAKSQSFTYQSNLACIGGEYYGISGKDTGYKIVRPRMRE